MTRSAPHRHVDGNLQAVFFLFQPTRPNQALVELCRELQRPVANFAAPPL